MDNSGKIRNSWRYIEFQAIWSKTQVSLVMVILSLYRHGLDLRNGRMGVSMEIVGYDKFRGALNLDLPSLRTTFSSTRIALSSPVVGIR